MTTERTTHERVGPVSTGWAGSDEPVGSPLLPYQYATLRCVPRVDREEFVNVGVVLFCQAADELLSAHEIHPERLLALDPDLDLTALETSLAHVADVCTGRADRGDLGRQGARFGWLTAPRSTVVQPGPRHGGLTADPHAELARLVAALVTPPGCAAR